MDANDILLDDSYDLMIENGDFKIGFSEDQHISLILLSDKGSWRQSPLSGVGLIKYMNGPFTARDLDDLKQAIKIQLQLDGYNDSEIQITSFEDINISATR